MADASQFPDAVWDRFFHFICADVDSISPAEVTTRLAQLGIDTEKQKSRIHQALDCRKARASLESAKRKRNELLAKPKSFLSVPADTLRSSIQQLIRERFHESAQAAYFRKLETAATDKDLLSLLEDLHFLDDILREESNVGTKGQ